MAARAGFAAEPPRDPLLQLEDGFLALFGGPKRAPYAEYASDPVCFARDVLGVEPWGRVDGMPAEHASQVEVLEAVRDCQYAAVRSGHKVGKSKSAAILAIWWVHTRVQGYVTMTAPSATQVEQILWSEIRILHQNAKRPLVGAPNLDPHNGWELGPGWGIFGRTTNKPERMSGISGALQLTIVDEASGYPEDIYTSIFGNQAGGGKVLLLSNPTQTSGTYFDVFHTKRSGWKLFHISSTSTPNFFGREIPGLAAPQWERWARDHWGGPGAPLYDVRVAGEFPKQGENVVVPLGYVEAARARWPTTADDGDLEIGVDVAREGDDESVIAPTRGPKLLKLVVVQLSQADGAMPPGHQVGEAVVRVARELRRPSDRHKPRVKVDAIGVGTSVVDHLVANYSAELDIMAVNSACSADASVVVVPATDTMPEQTAAMMYLNLRAQMAFGVRDWLREGGAIPEDGRLEGELVAPTYYFAAKGKLAIEDKSAVKKRLSPRRSPDRADALALAVYRPLRVESVPIEAHDFGNDEYRFGRGRGFG